MRSFVDPSLWGGDPVRYSPNGRQFFVVTQKGDLASDTNVYELNVFSVDTLDDQATTLAPLRSFLFRSANNTPAIAQARWLEQGTSIGLLGIEGNGESQVYRLDVRSGLVTRLTDAELGVYAFDFNGDALIYFARVERRGDLSTQYYPGRLLDRSYIQFFDQHWIGDTFATFVSIGNGQHRQVGSPVSYPYPIIWTSFRLAPNGERAIMTTAVPPGDAPSAWGPYQTLGVTGSNRFYQRVDIVDMRAARIESALDTPTGQAVDNDGAVEALWSRDSKRVILTNVCLPLDQDTERRTRLAYIVDYSVANSAYRVVGEMPTPAEDNAGFVREVEWIDVGEQFIVKQMTGRTVTGGRRYSRRGSKWSGRELSSIEATASPSGTTYTVAIEESPSAPPKLLLRVSDKTISLFAEDSALSDVAMTPVEEFTWTDDNNNRWSGLLSVPSSSPRPMPLVIQVGSGADSKRFLPEGGATTAHAAQSLNSVGIAVLRVPISDIPGFGTAEEGPSFVAGVDAAVAELERRGLIDRTRVGLVGHSRGGYLTQLAITHPGRIQLRAAIAADAFSGGYAEYLHMEPGSLDRQIYERLYGGESFWSNPNRWLALAPTFNADRSRTPLLLEPIGLPALLGTQEFYASLRLNARPVELLYFPLGEHQLVRPRERLTSIVATVDWMRFWLQDYETDDHDKRPQYARWRVLRQERDRLVKQAGSAAH